jgi:hypothetical protein
MSYAFSGVLCKKKNLHNTNHSSPREAIEKWLVGWAQKKKVAL